MSGCHTFILSLRPSHFLEDPQQFKNNGNADGNDRDWAADIHQITGTYPVFMRIPTTSSSIFSQPVAASRPRCGCRGRELRHLPLSLTSVSQEKITDHWKHGHVNDLPE